MFRSIVHTLGTKFFMVLLQLALLYLTTKLMGAAIKGAISILILNLTLVSLLGGVFGGPALVYLAPRFRLRSLLVIGYGWMAIVAPIFAGVFAFWFPTPPGFGLLLILALAEGCLSVHTHLLIGSRKIARHNFTLLLKPAVVVAVLVGLQFTRGDLSFSDFVWAYLAGLGAGLLLSGLLLPAISAVEGQNASIADVLRAAFRLGFVVVIGSISQLLNYRLSFYLLELFTAAPLALVRIGVYSAVLQVGESVLQFARSVSIVQYSEVSNLDDEERGLQISLSLVKLNYVVTILGVAILLLVPESIYSTIFGAEFSEIKAHVYWLAPGLVALAISGGFSHYFSGIGLHRYNTRASLFGLAVTGFLGIPAIYLRGTYGAAGVASVVYVAQMVYQFILLRRLKKVRLADLLIRGGDIRRTRRLIGRVLGR